MSSRRILSVSGARGCELGRAAAFDSGRKKCPADVLENVAVALRCLAMAFEKVHGDGQLQQEELTNVQSKAVATVEAPQVDNMVMVAGDTQAKLDHDKGRWQKLSVAGFDGAEPVCAAAASVRADGCGDEVVPPP